LPTSATRSNICAWPNGTTLFSTCLGIV
jgi:hypothetical protein